MSALWSLAPGTSGRELRELKRQASTIPVEFQWPYEGSRVFVAGSFSNWQERFPLTKDAEGTWRVTLRLHPGVYTFKFVVDDNWYFDMSREHTRDPEGTVNNVVRVTKPSTKIYS